MKLKFKILLFIGFIWLWTILVASTPNRMIWRNLSPEAWFFQGVEATYTPGGGTPIKSIQHIANGGPSGNVGIATVNLSYAVISMAGYGLSSGVLDTVARATFASASAVTINTATASAAVGFDVIEYMPAALPHATARDLTVTFAPTPGGFVDIGHGYTVNLAKSMATYQGCYYINGQTNPNSAFTAFLVGTTVVRVSRSGAGDYGYTCSAGMVEFR